MSYQLLRSATSSTSEDSDVSMDSNLDEKSFMTKGLNAGTTASHRLYARFLGIRGRGVAIVAAILCIPLLLRAFLYAALTSFRYDA